MSFSSSSLLSFPLRERQPTIIFFFQNPGGAGPPPQNHSGGGAAPMAPLATPQLIFVYSLFISSNQLSLLQVQMCSVS